MERTYSALNKMYDEIETAIQNDPILNATGDFKTLINDKEFMRAYHLRKMAMSDWTSMIEGAFREGLEKGRKEYLKEKKLEIARKMKEMGEPIEKIHAITGLRIKTIEKLGTDEKATSCC